MKELFTFLWTAAPELMSLLVIIGFLCFIIYKIMVFFSRFENMEADIISLRSDLNALRADFNALNAKVDRIIEYLLNERSTKKSEP